MSEPFEKARKSRKYLAWACLFTGLGAGFLWRALAGTQLWYHLWQSFYGKVPDAFFFRLEEFFALMHPNSALGLWGARLFLFGGVLMLLILSRKMRRWYENVLLIIILVFMIFFMQPCLCASKEHGRRINCGSDFKHSFAVLKAKGDPLPEKFEWKQNGTFRHTVICSGAGKSLDAGKRFILLEDAPRSHAGDMRHRLWSDGTVEVYYPWKGKKP